MSGIDCKGLLMEKTPMFHRNPAEEPVTTAFIFHFKAIKRARYALKNFFKKEEGQMFQRDCKDLSV